MKVFAFKYIVFKDAAVFYAVDAKLTASTLDGFVVFWQALLYAFESEFQVPEVLFVLYLSGRLFH